VGRDKLDGVAATRKWRRGQGKLRAAARMLCAERKKEREQREEKGKREKKKKRKKLEEISNSDFSRG
jgi:hypothetical protein